MGQHEQHKLVAAGLQLSGLLLLQQRRVLLLHLLRLLLLLRRNRPIAGLCLRNLEAQACARLPAATPEQALPLQLTSAAALTTLAMVPVS